MGFKNDQELTRAIMNTMQGVLREIQNKAYDVVKIFMDIYYSEYTPIPKERGGYERTRAFYNSLVKSEIKKTTTGYQCSVYIDLDKMNEYQCHDGETVMDMINRGFHADTGMNSGGYNTPYDIKGTAVWDESINEIERTDLILKTFSSFFNANFKGGN